MINTASDRANRPLPPMQAKKIITAEGPQNKHLFIRKYVLPNGHEVFIRFRNGRWCFSIKFTSSPVYQERTGSFFTSPAILTVKVFPDQAKYRPAMDRGGGINLVPYRQKIKLYFDMPILTICIYLYQ